jgi:hypothetical protein
MLEDSEKTGLDPCAAPWDEEGKEAPFARAEDLVARSNEELAGVDPAEMNLRVAKGLASLAGTDILYYQGILDEWAGDIGARLPAAEVQFRKTPQDWKNDIRFFRLGMVCWYVDQVLDIRYREDQRNLKRVRYTDPSDLFLNGVIDTRRGTCGNMATLHVALCWRLGWPTSLACAGSHYICRFDDGQVRHNIEATKTGGGGFHSHPDEYYLKEYQLPHKAITCGSDLRAVKPREMLGLFFGARGRHLENMDHYEEAERDYLLARYLFPRNRHLYVSQNQTSIQCSLELLEPGEKGHPTELVTWLQEVVRMTGCKPTEFLQPKEVTSHERYLDSVFQDLGENW